MARIIGILLFILLIVVVYFGITQGVSRIHWEGIGKFYWPKPAYVSSTAPTVQVKKSTVTVSKPASTLLTKNEEPKPPTPPAGFTVRELSPYYEKIQISNVQRGSSYNSLNGISLRADYSMKSGIFVTGWRVKTNRGEITIPQAVADYKPGGYSGAGSIFLESSQSLVIYSSMSPLQRNLRLNKCIGYLNNSYVFVPTLPNNCPSINRNEVIGYSGACQTFIFSLGASCREPKPNDINRFASPNDLGCQNFLAQLNYNGCYNRYRGDANFFSSEWRAWLNNRIPLDAYHDRVQLFDSSGLLVDQYIY